MRWPLDPDHSGGLSLEVDAGGALGDGMALPLEERREIIMRGLTREPDSAGLHQSLGELAEESGEWEEAEEHYRESLDLDFEQPHLWKKLGRLALRRDLVDRVLVAPMRGAMWLFREGEAITLFMGVVLLIVWGVVCGPVVLLYRFLFKMEHEVLRAKPLVAGQGMSWRKGLRWLLFCAAAVGYWGSFFFLRKVADVWELMGWVLKGALILVVGAGIYWGVMESIAMVRHRKLKREIEEDDFPD